MTTTAWGKAKVIEEVTVKQSAGGKPFATIVQLLEGAQSERLVRLIAREDSAAQGGAM